MKQSNGPRPLPIFGFSRRFPALRRMLPFMLIYRTRIAAALLALLINSLAILGLGQGFRRLVDYGLDSGNLAMLDRAIIVVIGIVVLLAGSTYCGVYLVSWIGERVVADIRCAVFNRVIALSPAYFEVRRTGDILSRLTTDTTLLQTVIGSTVSQGLRNALLLVGGLAMLAVTSIKLTLLALLIVPVVIVPILVSGRRMQRLSRTTQDAIAAVGAYAEEAINAIRTVQAFTHEATDRARFGTRVEAAFAVARRRIAMRAGLIGLVILATFGGMSLAIWIGGRNVLEGQISGGDLSAFVFYAVVVAMALGMLSEVWSDLQRAAGAAASITELLDAVADIKAPPVPVALPDPSRGLVAFDNVGFCYPGSRGRPALQHFTITVARGETVALVGRSGAGKTTVFQLLLRFYDPQHGTVRIDGVDLRTADPTELRRRIGLVPQDPVIFSADAWENIGFGRPGATQLEIRAAAEAAHATEFLDLLPRGFATFLGDKGVRLSGGQRQRVAIARAILRDPAILLLDEATSSLDAESEHAVQSALATLSAGRATIVIAHRLATVLRAHRIIVLEEGRVVAAGCHAELLRQGGLYARLAALQFNQPGAHAAAGEPVAGPLTF
ncbi:MAG: ABC transporter transmembrane domain-containing protein [Stellaceae bacterium]